eukprot:352625-Amorphochlora_amoeboformis.AAC.2
MRVASEELESAVVGDGEDFRNVWETRALAGGGDHELGDARLAASPEVMYGCGRVPFEVSGGYTL